MTRLSDEAAPTLQFLGGAGTVTGSKYLIRAKGRQLLLDCGLFQGLKALRLRNWREPPFEPSAIDAVVLSHAHIDHSGYLPLLARRGFRGPVYCTPATRSLLRIMLPDAAHLQEEEAAYANRKGYSKHHPAEPLFKRHDARQALNLLKPRTYGQAFKITGHDEVVLRRAGHILGSASIELRIGRRQPLTLVYSGDLGRWGRPIIRDPEFVPAADILVVESTYGDRTHAAEDPSDELARVVNDAVKRGGVLLIPAFAVGRTQEVIWKLRELEDAGRIPRLPVFIDSPMATDATEIYCQHPEEHDIDMKLLMDEHRCPLCCKPCQFTRNPEESKALNRLEKPAIIIASSGMATGGRIVHHLKQRLPDPRTTVLLVGYQAAGTRGRSLQDGASTVRMHGQDVPVRATVETIHGLSAHADRSEILRWLRGFTKPPRQTYIVHGEPPAAEALRDMISAELGWSCALAQDLQTVRLAV
ncbi:MAG: MBL fold hydrolase [Gemmatales bacterium]|nr:MAG: MBL fold hydrolase [Gemmatales bacterium]